jgi:glutamate N-acetyltransferase / amino-acid N-acetyltransferase
LPCSRKVWYIFYVLKSSQIERLTGGGITSAKGFFAGAVYSGIKKKTRDALDLAVFYSEVSGNAAAVFTQNKIKAAPVIIDRERIRRNGKARAVLINSGCANACTGREGMANAEATAVLLAKSLGIPANEVLVASTGVIGVQLPMEKISEGIQRLILSREAGHELTRAIMTTDTRPKEIALKVKAGGSEFIVGGTAKGAGMIHPDMATMLCFITTDARVDNHFLDLSLKKSIRTSFNMISVDGDTSTNDTVLVIANGTAGTPLIDAKSELAQIFRQALEEVCLYLAKSIAGDGEGATRLIEVRVNGARNMDDARLAARTIASSPLVKTAVHGCDPNWGRIIAAAGRSGAEMEELKTDVYIGDLCLLKSGIPLPFDKKGAAAILGREEARLRLELNLGRGRAVAWGCDLSEEYVVINSEYTT